MGVSRNFALHLLFAGIIWDSEDNIRITRSGWHQGHDFCPHFVSMPQHSSQTQHFSKILVPAPAGLPWCRHWEDSSQCVCE